MAKVNDFDNILSECLDRMIKGETIEQCLARYPQHAKELEPLLKTAEETRTAASVKPSDWFRQRAGIEFQEAVRNMPVKPARKATGGGFRWQVRWVAPLAVLLVMITGVGTVSAATNALPDSPLYGVKLAVESVQMTFTFSDEGKSELYAKFVDNRVEEIVVMAQQGNYVEMEKVTNNMASQLSNVAVMNTNVSNSNIHKDAAGFSIAGMSEDTQGPVTYGSESTQMAPPKNTEVTTDTTSPENFVKPGPRDSNEPSGVSNTVTPANSVDNLRIILTNRFEKDLQILEEQLAKAPDVLKPYLQKAIDVLRLGYEQAISNLVSP